MAETARTFTGGEQPQSGVVGGEISVGHYEGPEAHASHPWKCPKCGVENTTRLELGCPSCGGGVPGRHIGLPPPTPTLDRLAAQGAPSPLYDAARQWADAHPTAGLAAAFLAGYELATQQITAHIVQATPVTADVAALAPAGKPTRTIIAALDLFKDQVLAHEPEEVQSGEWCSAAEVDALITKLHERPAID